MRTRISTAAIYTSVSGDEEAEVWGEAPSTLTRLRRVPAAIDGSDTAGSEERAETQY
jgi:hypothetical protein